MATATARLIMWQFTTKSAKTPVKSLRGLWTARHVRAFNSGPLQRTGLRTPNANVVSLKVPDSNGFKLQRLFEIVDRLFDSLVERHARLPAENFFCTRDIRLADLGVIHR